MGVPDYAEYAGLKNLCGQKPYNSCDYASDGAGILNIIIQPYYFGP